MNPHSLEVRLDWLIASSGIVQPCADRRLNAIENQLVNGASQWRESHPIEPAREIQLSESTRVQLLAWVTDRELANTKTARRLRKYVTAVRAGIPDGWIRLTIC